MPYYSPGLDDLRQSQISFGTANSSNHRRSRMFCTDIHNYQNGDFQHCLCLLKEEKRREKKKAKQPAVKRGLVVRYCQETRRGVTPSTTPFCMKERGVGEACFIIRIHLVHAVNAVSSHGMDWYCGSMKKPLWSCRDTFAFRWTGAWDWTGTHGNKDSPCARIPSYHSLGISHIL